MNHGVSVADELSAFTGSEQEKGKRPFSPRLLPLRIRLQLLFGIVLLQLIILTFLLPKNREFLQATHWGQTPAVPSAYSSPQDALLQSSFPNIGRMAQSAMPNRSPRPFLLVPVGECASCISIDLRIWAEAARKRDLDMILMSSADAQTSRKFVHDLKLSLPVVMDKDGAINRQLNAAWVARPYLFSSEGRLLWRSQEHQMHYSPFRDKTFLDALKSAPR